MPDPFSNVPPPDTQKRRTLCESLLVPTFHTWNSTSDLCQQEMDERRDPRRLCVGSSLSDTWVVRGWAASV